MPRIVLLLNILAALAGIVLVPTAIYFGMWGLLGGAYDQPGAVLAGVLVMIVPPVVLIASIVVSRRMAKQGRSSAVAVAAIPFIVAVVAIAASPLKIGVG